MGLLVVGNRGSSLTAVCHLQGTLVDRIDYNIEKTQTSVKSGLQQLTKAEKYQRSNRKMLIVVVLAVVVIILSILLIFKLFR